MDLLRGNYLVNWNDEPVIANELMRSCQYVGLYFSASWCPPCQTFLPMLKELFRKATERKFSFQIVFVPSDTDDQRMRQFFLENHGSWYAVPVGSLTVALRKKMRIYAIPELVVTTTKGQVLTKTGKSDMENLEDPLSVWMPVEKSSKEEEQESEENKSEKD